MMATAPAINAKRILIVMPTWVGDVVMATPTLRALRSCFDGAHITALTKPAGEAILQPCPWLDQVVSSKAQLRGRFDTGILLANSFRAAWIAKIRGCKRLIGYARDGRSWMLTDQLLAPRDPAGYLPMPALRYYLEIARYLGGKQARDVDPRMEIFIADEDKAKAQQLLVDAGCDSTRPLVLLNPGASFGPAKMWPASRFAEVADRLIQEHGVQVAVTGSPAEQSVVDQVIAGAQEPMVNLVNHSVDLHTLKEVVRHASLLITNDTGPRHIAAALGTPVVTIFGSTDPRWTEIDFDLERQVMVDVFCGPCQRKQCPLDHRCMSQLTVDMVFDPASELLALQGTTQ